MSSTKGRSRKVLLRGTYYNTPSPWGTVQSNVEVWLHVQVRLGTDDKDDGQCGSSEGGDHRSDLLGADRVCSAIAERIAQLVESATPASASLEKVAQAELFEGLYQERSDG